LLNFDIAFFENNNKDNKKSRIQRKNTKGIIIKIFIYYLKDGYSKTFENEFYDLH
jgi:hypothetical protein